MSEQFHIAQFNIARFHHPMDAPEMAGFVEKLDPINQLAENTPGFVWRLVGADSNDATTIAFYEDPLLLVNMSVWTDLESLKAYVYQSDHVEVFKRRAEWADPLESSHLVLWWVPAGHIPTVAEADERLKQLVANGATAEAFTFATTFGPPES
jgi:hypothetical protein